MFENVGISTLIEHKSAGTGTFAFGPTEREVPAVRYQGEVAGSSAPWLFCPVALLAPGRSLDDPHLSITGSGVRRGYNQSDKGQCDEGGH